MTAVLAAGLVLFALAGCGGGSGVGTTSTTATSTSVPQTTTTTAATTTMTTAAATITTSTTASTTTTTTMPPDPAPFTEEDLAFLVLAPEEGQGLVEGLEHRPGYSGAAGLSTVRHITLVPPERLEALGFAAGRWTSFFTDPFLTEWGRAGRSLVSMVLLFPTPEAAEAAQQVLVDSFEEFWAEWAPLRPIQEGFPGVRGWCGTDNTTDLYPTIGFNFRVGNVVALVGSAGGAQQDDPLPEDMVRSIAEDLLARAEARLAEIQAGG